MNKLFFPLVSLAFFGCNSKHSFDHQLFYVGTSRGVLDNHEINEASGLAASICNPGMLWTQNDSGDKPRIFLIDEYGKHKATINLPGIKNRDWEDIAVGPGPEKDTAYLYIGDIGDNFARHEYKYIYRLKEPKVKLDNEAIESTIMEIDSIKFKLPDGKRDSEAMMIDPITSDLYVFSKREENVNLYVLDNPQSDTEIITARFVTQLPFTQINAADISADGREILIKNYSHVYYWKLDDDELLKDVFKRKPYYPPYITEPQGEAIAFDRSGTGYFTLSEETNNKKPHLMFYLRKD